MLTKASLSLSSLLVNAGKNNGLKHTSTRRGAGEGLLWCLKAQAAIAQHNSCTSAKWSSELGWCISANMRTMSLGRV